MESLPHLAGVIPRLSCFICCLPLCSSTIAEASCPQGRRHLLVMTRHEASRLKEKDDPGGAGQIITIPPIEQPRQVADSQEKDRCLEPEPIIVSITQLIALLPCDRGGRFADAPSLTVPRGRRQRPEQPALTDGGFTLDPRSPGLGVCHPLCPDRPAGQPLTMLHRRGYSWHAPPLSSGSDRSRHPHLGAQEIPLACNRPPTHSLYIRRLSIQSPRALFRPVIHMSTIL